MKKKLNPGYDDVLGMPYLNKTELTLRELPYISKNSLKEFYTLLDKSQVGNTDTEDLGLIYIYRNRINNTIVSGFFSDEKFIPTVTIFTKKVVTTMVPSGLANDYFQVSMVEANKNNALQGRARMTYLLLAQHTDIVSDQEQYPPAKALWLSLARQPYINIYIWDGSKNDYIRTVKGRIVRFDGNNAAHDQICGDRVKHSRRLLVATTKTFK